MIYGFFKQRLTAYCPFTVFAPVNGDNDNISWRHFALCLPLTLQMKCAFKFVIIIYNNVLFTSSCQSVNISLSESTVRIFSPVPRYIDKIWLVLSWAKLPISVRVILLAINNANTTRVGFPNTSSLKRTRMIQDLTLHW